jgi:hypothetical protein
MLKKMSTKKIAPSGRARRDIVTNVYQCACRLLLLSQQKKIIFFCGIHGLGVVFHVQIHSENVPRPSNAA